MDSQPPANREDVREKVHASDRVAVDPNPLRFEEAAENCPPEPPAKIHVAYTTFQDVIDHGIDYLGGNRSENSRRDCVRAALEAYRDLANAFNWSYLYTHWRIITSAAFDGAAKGRHRLHHTGGAYDRQATISGTMARVGGGRVHPGRRRAYDRPARKAPRSSPWTRRSSRRRPGLGDGVRPLPGHVPPARGLRRPGPALLSGTSADGVHPPEGVALQEPLLLRQGHPPITRSRRWLQQADTISVTKLI